MAGQPVIDLGRRGLDGDDALAETTWPPFLPTAGAVLGLTLIAITIGTMAAAARDHDTRLDPLAVLAVAAAGLPWLSCNVLARTAEDHPMRSGWGRHLCELGLVLVMQAAANLAVLAGLIDLGSDAAPHLLSFPALFVVALAVAGRPLRSAVVTTFAAYLTIVIGILAAARQAGELDVVAAVTWHAAFLFAVASAAAVRTAIIAIHRTGEVQAEQAVEATRRRVARDVHDVVAHTLAVTMLHISAARMAVERGSREEAIEALEEAERHGRSSLVDIRRMVRLLRADEPSLDDPQPGVGDVDDLVEGYRAAGLPVDLRVVGDTDRISPGAGLALYRAAQEALANATRHGVGPATVELQVADDVATLTVDNCIRPGDDPPRSTGSGLLGMHERIAAAGGTLTARREGQRWEVRALVPVSHARKDRSS